MIIMITRLSALGVSDPILGSLLHKLLESARNDHGLLRGLAAAFLGVYLRPF